MNEIRIKNLEIFAYHGVLEEEKKNGQKFYVDATLKTDFLQAAKEDNLSLSTHYGEVCLQIKESMTHKSHDLIESVARKVAEDILVKFPLVDEITLELKKPFAPIPLEFESVSVALSRKWHKVYLAYGSNEGNREENIKKALKVLEEAKEFRNMKVSTMHTSYPYGGVEQDNFVNGALYIETYLEPRELLSFLQETENLLGRKKTVRWGPRTIDLDIIFYDDLFIDEEELQIPHKDMMNRDFVLIPMMEIAAFKRHPLFGRTIEEMARGVKEHYLI